MFVHGLFCTAPEEAEAALPARLAVERCANCNQTALIVLPYFACWRVAGSVSEMQAMVLNMSDYADCYFIDSAQEVPGKMDADMDGPGRSWFVSGGSIQTALKQVHYPPYPVSPRPSTPI